MNTQTFALPITNPRVLSSHKTSIEVLCLAITQQDDQQAFASLFKKCYTPLCYYAMKTVASREVAEEVVSDVFVKFWNNRHKIQVHSSFDSYLYRSVKNHSLDFLRSSLNEKFNKESLSEYHAENIAADYDTPIEQLSTQETTYHIEQAISKLPKQCQLVFRMNRIEGLKYREVADKLQISMKAVESNMTRALKQLREQLAYYNN
jgi:RNA polymerase sigma-70 factor (ECF subfamily)